MKQHTTIEQLNGLSEKGKKILAKWLKEKNYVGNRLDDCIELDHKKGFSMGYIFILSIGQMIEFLDEHDFWDKEEKKRKTGEDIKYVGIFKIGYWLVDARIVYAGREGELLNGEIEDKELCDALWEAVKEVLEKK